MDILMAGKEGLTPTSYTDMGKRTIIGVRAAACLLACAAGAPPSTDPEERPQHQLLFRFSRAVRHCCFPF